MQDGGKHNRHLPSYCYPEQALYPNVKARMAKARLISHVAGW